MKYKTVEPVMVKVVVLKDVSFDNGPQKLNLFKGNIMSLDMQLYRELSKTGHVMKVNGG